MATTVNVLVFAQAILAAVHCAKVSIVTVLVIFAAVLDRLIRARMVGKHAVPNCATASTNAVQIFSTTARNRCVVALIVLALVARARVIVLTLRI